MAKLDLFERMTERFQCPGCVCGSGICGKYKRDTDTNACSSHVLGTLIMPVGHIALGLPKGFNRPGGIHREIGPSPERRFRDRSEMPLRFFSKGEPMGWNRFNVPVWKLYRDGFTFVRTYSPRINEGWTDVIEGKVDVLAPAVDIAPFLEEMD